MQSRPDSALALLKQIDTTKLRSHKLKAEYSLAYVIALDKNYIDTTNTALLKPALSYYRRRGSTENKMLTFYYLGRLQSNAHSFTDACVSYDLAWAEAKKTDNVWMKGMICSAFSLAYNNNHLSREQLIYAQRAYDYFSEYGDSLYIDNALFHLASAYHNNRQPDKADSLYALVNPRGRFGAMARLRQATNIMLMPDPAPEDALVHFRSALDMGAHLKLDEWYQYICAQYLTGNTEYADRLMAQMENRPADARALWWKYAISYRLKRYKEACELYEQYSVSSDTLIKQLLQQSVYKAEKEQYKYEAEEARYEKERIRIGIAIILIFALLIFAIVTLAYYRKKEVLRQKNALLEQQFSDAQRMVELVRVEASSEIQTMEDKLLALRTSFAKMYKTQFSSIGELYNKNLDLSVAFDKGQQAYAKKVAEILSEIESGTEKQKQFEVRVDKDLDQIMAKLRNDFPEFSEDSFRMLSYYIVGFHTNVIASIMCMDPGAVRTRKSRLRKRILTANTRNYSLYEAFLK